MLFFRVFCVNIYLEMLKSHVQKEKKKCTFDKHRFYCGRLKIVLAKGVKHNCDICIQVIINTKHQVYKPFLNIIAKLKVISSVQSEFLSSCVFFFTLF